MGNGFLALNIKPSTLNPLRLTAYGLRFTAYVSRLTAYSSRLTTYGLRQYDSISVCLFYCFLNQLRKAGFWIAKPGKIRFKIKALVLSQPEDVVARHI